MNTQTELKVPDITCGGCAGSIKKALGSVQGINHVNVDIATKTVTVQHDDGLPREEIIKRLDRAGFPAS